MGVWRCRVRRRPEVVVLVFYNRLTVRVDSTEIDLIRLLILTATKQEEKKRKIPIEIVFRQDFVQIFITNLAKHFARVAELLGGVFAAAIVVVVRLDQIGHPALLLDVFLVALVCLPLFVQMF